MTGEAPSPAGPGSEQGRGGELTGRHVLLGVSGGIAAYKAALVARDLLRAGATVQAVLTHGAARFVGAATFEGLTGRAVVADTFDDAVSIPHVQMAREADVAVIAPATANVLGKFAHGIADDLLTSTFTCLTCPVVLAPAMHAEMWAHPSTQENVATLMRRGALVIGPEEGELAGGDVGLGRLAEPEDIVAAVRQALGDGGDGALAGRRVVVTAGGTREALDPVRFLGNRSSGRMGFAIAREAARRGARVDLVAAPTWLDTPAGVERHDVVSARDMHAAVLELAEAADVVVKAAAVADFRPARYSTGKLKKAAGPPRVELVANPDILADLGHRTWRGVRPLLVGFAAETGDEEAEGRRKLADKRADVVVVNRVDSEDAGFQVDTNRALIIDADGGRVPVDLTTKDRLAEALLDHVGALLTRRDEGAGRAPAGVG